MQGKGRRDVSHRIGQKEKGGETHVALDKFCEVDVPDLERDREREELDAPLVDLERLLEVLVLLEEGCIVDNDLGSSREGVSGAKREPSELFCDLCTWALAIRRSMMRS